MRRTMSLIFLAVALFGVSATGFFWYTGLNKTGSKGVVSVVTPIDSANEELSKRVSVLLIGADQRLDQTKYNTDSLILASVDPETQQISLLSIPRDTRVALPGHNHVKINAVMQLTNLQTLQKVVEELTGEKIAGYIQTNFQGFKQVIDTLGGITVDVEKDMYYETGDPEDGYINLHKGVQRLDGTKALEYARFRHDLLADISRTARQQVVLKAVAQEMLQLSTLSKLPSLIPKLMQAIQTNLSVKDLLSLAKAAVGFKSSDVISQTLPGSFLELDGVSYWEVNPLEVRTVVKNLFAGKTTDKVIDEEDVDLLKPIIPTPSKPLVKVPGNSQDPNGQKSTGYETFEFEVISSGDGTN